MSNYCTKHQQFYSDFCVYCGNPQEKWIAQTNAGYNTSNASYCTCAKSRILTDCYADHRKVCTCDETKTYNDCALHGKTGQNPQAA